MSLGKAGGTTPRIVSRTGTSWTDGTAGQDLSAGDQANVNGGDVIKSIEMLMLYLRFGTDQSRDTSSLLMVPLCTLIQAIPISFNGWGLREGVYVLYFKQVGLSSESALAFSIVAATLVVLLSISGLLVWVGRRSHAHEMQSPPPR